MVVKESPFIGLFPHGQTRTGCSPRIDYFCVGPSALSDPFQEIENQSIHWIRHDRLLANVSRIVIVVPADKPALPTNNDRAFRRIWGDAISRDSLHSGMPPVAALPQDAERSR
jgi:hypothetical protein